MGKCSVDALSKDSHVIPVPSYNLGVGLLSSSSSLYLGPHEQVSFVCVYFTQMAVELSGTYKGNLWVESGEYVGICGVVLNSSYSLNRSSQVLILGSHH